VPDTPDPTDSRLWGQVWLSRSMQNALASCKMQRPNSPSRVTFSCKSKPCNRSRYKSSLPITCTE
jgi:hypothetical protein